METRRLLHKCLTFVVLIKQNMKAEVTALVVTRLAGREKPISFPGSLFLHPLGETKTSGFYYAGKITLTVIEF